ncbi:proenkephalin b [Triplophysa dalaica]|uniref:proenkephalin b n=1 Tax=Triplophysa dalaica TaxID=1582913 RepID=UPI0024DF653D|nr:proenkephalin b [Triplophysa dalaica]
MKPPTIPVSSRWTLLLVIACLTLTARADCGTDCAFCAARLPLPHTDINSIECVLACEERLNAASSWSLCKRFMQNTDSTPDGETQELDDQQHQVDKKYGGFMKRYGGFMKRYGGFMKKTAELYELEPKDDQNRGVLINHDVEMLTNQGEADGEREAALGDDSKEGAEGVRGMAKRYGGFMKKGGFYDTGSEEKPLEKRYGGFMRRVGRPEWWQETKRYGGFLKRSPVEDGDEDSLEIEKRYGGFMGY